MTNPIVHVNVSQTQAPIPSNLQKTGAMLSQGGTLLTAGQYSLLTQFSDLTPLLAPPLALSGLTWTSAFGGQVTATAAAPHGVPLGKPFPVTIAGAVPAAYNGNFNAIAASPTTFTYYQTPNPGIMSTPGTYTPANSGELSQMASTFFSQQGSAQGVYVLELGPGTVAQGVSMLQSIISSSPQFFYSYLVPRGWDGDPAFLAYAATFEATTSKTYFFVTTTLQTYAQYNGMKDVLAMVEAPNYSSWPQVAINAATYSSPTGLVTLTTATAHGIAPGQTFTVQGISPIGYDGSFQALPGTTGTALVYALAHDPGAYVTGGTILRSIYNAPPISAIEFSHASDYFVTLAYDPGPANRVPQLGFSYLYGVTPYPMLGNSAQITTLDNAFVNYVGTGAEGGQPTSQVLFNGLTMDGRPFNYWYSVDWVQINAKMAVANAVINGSNTTINPLYYNQQGIDRLQQALVGMVGSGITAGLILGSTVQLQMDGPTLAQTLSTGKYAGMAVVNAVPFPAYTKANESHYRQGIYNGLSITFTPLSGFRSITVYINVTDFVG
jgi:hypothetical protein